MTLKIAKISQIKHSIIALLVISILLSAYPQITEAKFSDIFSLEPATEGIASAENFSTEAMPTLEPELPMKDWVLNKVAEAGLNPQEAEAIINCESRWNPDAMGINRNRTADLGLWQINSIHKDISNADKLDYKKATDWAIAKRLKDGHWGAWYCARKIARR